jgi:hypothetical protein
MTECEGATNLNSKEEKKRQKTQSKYSLTPIGGVVFCRNRTFQKLFFWESILGSFTLPAKSPILQPRYYSYSYACISDCEIRSFRLLVKNLHL